ncbi:MAG: hypothetical protein ACRC1K_24950, partial [Planctomycetia bacterium]
MALSTVCADPVKPVRSSVERVRAAVESAKAVAREAKEIAEKAKQEAIAATAAAEAAEQTATAARQTAAAAELAAVAAEVVAKALEEGKSTVLAPSGRSVPKGVAKGVPLTNTSADDAAKQAASDFDNGHWMEAASSWKKAITLNPDLKATIAENYAAAVGKLGDQAYRAPNYEQAISYYREAAEIDPA